MRSDSGGITEIYKGEVAEEEVHWSLAGVQPQQDPGDTLRMNGVGG